MFTFSVILLTTLLTKYVYSEGCETPTEFKNFEKTCFDETSDFLKKVQYQATGLLNKAKKLVGVEAVEENEPKRCEYYVCLFKKINVTNLADIPDPEALKKWIEENSSEENKTEILRKMNICFNNLYRSLKSGTLFQGNYEPEDIDIELKEYNIKFSDLKLNQTACDIDKEFMLCLSWQLKCALFRYP